MYRALRSVAPEKSARGFIERQQSSIFTAEIHFAVFHNRLTTELKRIRYRPHHATRSFIKCISSTIEPARKDFASNFRAPEKLSVLRFQRDHLTACNRYIDPFVVKSRCEICDIRLVSP